MRATAPTLRRRTFARAEATRAWVEATKRQALDTSDDQDSLSDANTLNSLSDNDNSLDSDSDAGRQQPPPPQTTNPPRLNGTTKSRQRLTAGGHVTRRSLEARQNLLDPNTSDDDNNSLSDGNSLSDSLDSADTSADEAARPPLPTANATATRPAKLGSKDRARLAAKHRRALEARQAQAVDSDSADNDSIHSADSSADEARPLKRRPTRTQKTRRARRALFDARQAVDTSASDDANSLDSGLSDNSVDSVDSQNSLTDGITSADEARPTSVPTARPTLASKTRQRLTAGQRTATRRSLAAVQARQNQTLLDPNTFASDDNSLSDDNSVESDNSLDSLDSNSIDSASDSDVARPQPTNPPNATVKGGPKHLGSGSGTRLRLARLARREILGKHSDLVAAAEAAAEAEGAVPTTAPAAGETLLPGAEPEEEEEDEEEEEEDGAESVSSISSGESDTEDEAEEEEEEEEEEGEEGTKTGGAEPTATATDGAAATTVDGGAAATITGEPADALAPALPNLTLSPEATASGSPAPSSVLGAGVDGQPLADTQGQTQQTLVPVPKKMNAGEMAGIVIGVLGMFCSFFPFPSLLPSPSTCLNGVTNTQKQVSSPSSSASSSSSSNGVVAARLLSSAPASPTKKAFPEATSRPSPSRPPPTPMPPPLKTPTATPRPTAK